MTMILIAVFTFTAVVAAVIAMRMQPTAKALESELTADRKRRAMVNVGDTNWQAFNNLK